MFLPLSLNLLLSSLTYLVVINNNHNQVTALSQCSYFLHKYYECKYLEIEDESGQCSMSNVHLSDAFYNLTLKSLSTFEMAMDYFKAMNTELSGCTQEWCQCVSKSSIGFNVDDFLPFDIFQTKRFFFNNATFYPQMVALTKAMKQSCTLIYDSSDMYLSWYVNDPMQLNTTLNQFCLKNDFNEEMFVLYEETRKCLNLENPEPVKIVMYACMASYLGIGNRKKYATSWSEMLNFNNYSVNQLEQYSRCFISSMGNNCSMSIQRVALLDVIAEFPQIISNSNLTFYIDSLLRTAKTAPPFLQLVDTFVDQMMDVKSFNNTRARVCRFNFSANCFDSRNLKIVCAGPSTYTIMFVSGQQQVVFNVNGTTLPKDFGSGRKMMLTSNGTKWLEIFSNEQQIEIVNMTVIFDYQTNSTIEIR